MLAWLVAAPVAALTLLWIRARMQKRSAGGAEDATAGTVAPEAAADAPPQRPLEVLAGAVRLACGEGAQALAARLAALPRPGLHPLLRDRDGLPVLAAFDAGLDVESLAHRLAPAPGQRIAGEHLRALALLEPVALELFEAAARMMPAPPQAEAQVVAGLRRRQVPATGAGGSVRVVALLPPGLSESMIGTCNGWLRGLAAEAGLDPRRSAFEVACAPAADAAWRQVERLLSDGQGKHADWVLLLASASLVGGHSLRALASNDGLAAPGNAEGVVPGEGAAGLLLRPQGAIRALDAGRPPVLAAMRIEALEGGLNPRRAARSTADLLVALMATADVPRDDVVMVLSDADQRPSRSVEAAVAASAACPELDPADDCPALGVASGELGHVAPLALLALASARARDAGAPVLAQSVASMDTRVAVLVRPAGAADAAEPARNEAGPPPPDLAA